MLDDDYWMNEAIKLGTKSKSHVRVGVVFVKDGKLLISSYKGEIKDAIHAEEGAIIKANDADIDLSGSTVYTTLEPCSHRVNKASCSDLLIASKVSSVFIGSYDSNPAIYRKGWKKLRDAGIDLKDFNSQRRNMSKELNIVFDETFRHTDSLSGGARFDYTLNGGKFTFNIDKEKSKHIVSKWTQRGNNSIYAHDGRPGFVALAKYANSFEEIDDPDSLDYESHAVPVNAGEIVVFRNNDGHVYIKVIEVKSGHGHGDEDTSVKITYLVKPKVSE